MIKCSPIVNADVGMASGNAGTSVVTAGFALVPKTQKLREIIANSYRRHGLEFEGNQETTLVQETPHRLQMKCHLVMVASNELNWMIH